MTAKGRAYLWVSFNVNVSGVFQVIFREIICYVRSVRFITPKDLMRREYVTKF